MDSVPVRRTHARMHLRQRLAGSLFACEREALSSSEVAMWLSAVLLACAQACAVEGDLGLDDIVAAHRAGVEQLDTIDLKGEMRRRDDGSLFMSFRWTKSGARERYRTTNHSVAAGAGRFADWFLDGSRMSLLYNYDPDNAPDIRPFRQHGATASVRAQTRKLLDLFAATHLLLRLRLAGEDEDRPLWELVADTRRSFGDGGVQLVGRQLVGGRQTWQIHIQHPGVLNEQTAQLQYSGSSMDVFLDPGAGFLVRRLDCHVHNVATADGFIDLHHQYEVTAFKGFGDGTFLPMEVVSESRDGKGQRLSKFEHKIAVTQAAVNQPLPPDALDFRFPQNIMVVQLPMVPGKPRAYLIGKEGRIAETIDSEEKQKQVLRQAMVAEAQLASSRNWLFVVVGGALLMAMAAAFLLFRRKRRAVRCAS
ncbi:MAG: hypothetical protein HYS13_15205 [Planctomycetia bacterium]|nr:hypothetical protein [Planctomycetia bacterium]